LNILNLYLMGFWVNTPSGSLPCQWMRTNGVTSAESSPLGAGASIWTVGAWVNEKNERYTGGDSSPLLSTALMTKVWICEAVGLVGSMESGIEAAKKISFSLRVVRHHAVSPFTGLPHSDVAPASPPPGEPGGSMVYRKWSTLPSGS